MRPYTYRDSDGDRLEINHSAARRETAHVLIDTNAVYVPRAEAADAARALLTAAGATDYDVVELVPCETAVEDEGPTPSEPQPRYGVMMDPLPEGALLMPSYARSRPAKLVATWPDRQDVVEVASGRYGPLLAISARLNGEPIPADS